MMINKKLAEELKAFGKEFGESYDEHYGNFRSEEAFIDFVRTLAQKHLGDIDIDIDVDDGHTEDSRNVYVRLDGCSIMFDCVNFTLDWFKLNRCVLFFWAEWFQYRLEFGPRLIAPAVKKMELIMEMAHPLEILDIDEII